MSKYCPVCQAEFQKNIKQCPGDNVELLAKLEPVDIRVDIYAAKNEIEAERIVTYLRSEGVKAEKSVGGISQLPVDSDQRVNVMVPKSQVAKAKEMIENAIRDQVISSLGNFL